MRHGLLVQLVAASPGAATLMAGQSQAQRPRLRDRLMGDAANAVKMTQFDEMAADRCLSGRHKP